MGNCGGHAAAAGGLRNNGVLEASRVGVKFGAAGSRGGFLAEGRGRVPGLLARAC
jgi:hypothetical protein